MANMFNKNNWKEPLYKNDVINVVINGLVAGILGGVLAGALDYLFGLLNIMISFGLIILAYLVGYRVRKGYYSFHILYPVLAVLFMTLGLFFASLMQYFMLFNFSFVSLFSYFGNVLYGFFIMPFVYPVLAIRSGDGLNFIIYMINIVCYVLAYILCYRLASSGYRN